ncbi:MAG TPA: divalent metal cation transporter [Actinomycetota bacterium]|nr:divalent metal cation transporter [Actinomycetota bacterium]
MRKLLEIALGILTAIGGFVDIGDLVASTETGARFGLGLAWVIVLGVIGICVYAEMAGRVAAVSGRAVFDLVRDRLGAGVALVNLFASFFITLLTLAAEIGGVALALELATSVNYLLWVPVVAFLVWLVIWRVHFEVMENLFGLMGLALVVVAVAVWRAHADWGGLLHGATRPVVPKGEGHPTYFYFAIALLGSAMTPYEVFFFSSGAVEQRWTRADLMVNRANVYIGFPLGGLLALALMIGAALYLEPRGIDPGHLSQAALPTTLVLGKLGLAVLLLGFFACTFGAALETGLSCGYTIAQYFGWQWGKFVKPAEAATFHLVLLLSVVLGAGLLLTTWDPVKITEYSIVLSAAALPLTYFPVLVVANDRTYMGDKVNSRLSNAIASVFLVLLVVVAVATIPLMVLTKAGS